VWGKRGREVVEKERLDTHKRDLLSDGLQSSITKKRNEAEKGRGKGGDEKRSSSILL